MFQHIPASVECPEALSLKNRMYIDSPSTPMHSASGSAHSEVLGSAVISEEINSGEYHVSCTSETKPVYCLICLLRLPLYKLLRSIEYMNFSTNEVYKDLLYAIFFSAFS